MLDTSVQLDRFIDQVLQRLGLSRAELAQTLEISERSIARWQAGKSFPQYESRARLEELDLLADRVQSAFPTAAARDAWLREPGPDSEGQPLIEAILEDRFEVVRAALDRIEATKGRGRTRTTKSE
ncbi:MAG: hypothetical protein KC438_03080 [Thermomicrobiales bacterium]|nr:hypothetical protein [Thermomicrobiales bacterium]MCO5220706.1 hypothetical protein [Thermomicrobiales bacterium]